MNTVSQLTLHNRLGESILAKDLIKWQPPADEEFRPFQSIKYSWLVGEDYFEFKKEQLDGCTHLNILPDCSGFLLTKTTLIKKKLHWPNNCVLLDAYGEERIRLSVPWEMMGLEVSPEDQSLMHFWGTESPHLNPETGEAGIFGVRIVLPGGYMGSTEYYCELEWQTGKFLWCKRLQPGW